MPDPGPIVHLEHLIFGPHKRIHCKSCANIFLILGATCGFLSLFEGADFLERFGAGYVGGAAVRAGFAVVAGGFAPAVGLDSALLA
jgi:membrane-associated PAP2 superfamily phosphatase